MTTNRTPHVERALALAFALGSLALLCYKLLLAWRLNVNWDEFLYLSNVHALVRGDLRLVLQGVYTHLFTWLAAWPGDEVSQIVAGRVVMVALLGLSALLVLRLGRRWLDGLPLAISVFIFLSTMPVMLHGGSFRADSMLVVLILVSLVTLLLPPQARHRDWIAGAVLGAAFALTIKTVLFAPLVGAVVLFRGDGRRPDGEHSRTALLRSLACIAAVALLTAAVLILAHWLSVHSAAPDTITQFGVRTARKTVIDAQWFPRLDYLERYVRWQPLHWFLFAAGAVVALARRRFDLAALSLALLPVVFYRNAFPYFYVVMLAPLAVLAGYAVQEIRRLVAQYSRESLATVVVGVICIGLLYQGLAYIHRLSFDDQANQRMVVSAVHAIFPEPASYVDRCGMISSFRKVNFFMSTWGMDNYRARGTPFMPAAIRDHQPAFVLMNAAALNPNRRDDEGLLAVDSRLIARFYPRYWGPLRVAGAFAWLEESESTRLEVPFPARYRLRSEAEVLVDGVMRRDGDVMQVPADGILIRSARPLVTGTRLGVKLILATAREPPAEQLPNVSLFAGL